MRDKISVIRETDDDARNLARTLLRGARFGTLAVIDPETGYPSASRVLLATAPDGTPAILVSSLSAHTKALDADPRASLLTGEPGKGDPLAHPRLTLQARAERVERGSERHGWLRQRFLNRHPKAALYIDFDDFRFVLLHPQRASLNGGFGKAFVLEGSELIMNGPEIERFARSEQAILDEIGRDLPDLANVIARNKFHQNGNGWKISAIDAGGIDLSMKEILIRAELPLQDVRETRIIEDIRTRLSSIP